MGVSCSHAFRAVSQRRPGHHASGSAAPGSFPVIRSSCMFLTMRQPCSKRARLPSRACHKAGALSAVLGADQTWRHAGPRTRLRGDGRTGRFRPRRRPGTPGSSTPCPASPEPHSFRGCSPPLACLFSPGVLPGLLPRRSGLGRTARRDGACDTVVTAAGQPHDVRAVPSGDGRGGRAARNAAVTGRGRHNAR